MSRRLGRWAVLLSVSAASAQAAVQPAAVQPAAKASGPVLAAFPETPDPALRYAVYLHGRIVEEQGRQAVSPDFGPYRYDDILAALARPGVAVIGEVRAKGTDPKAAAAHVATEVNRLIDAGVPAEHVTVVGASRGAAIALLASTALPDQKVGWVVLAVCNESIGKAFDLALHGQVLSIYESSDEIGGTCGPLFAQSPALARHDEVRLETGLRHGFIYRPLAEWVEPAVAWILKRKL